MFRLTVDRVVQDASIVVRWCLDSETIRLLKECTKQEPKLLLIVTAGSPTLENRVLVPLENVIQRVSVRRPGQHTILSAIVWDVAGSARLQGEYLGQYKRGDYNSHIVEYPKLDFPESEGITPRLSRHLGLVSKPLAGIPGPSLEVVVPKQVFAKEPPRWEQGWVNRFFRMPPQDECEYRGRRLFAYTLQPILVLLILAARCVFALALGIASLILLAAGFYKLGSWRAWKRFRFADLWGEGELMPEENYWHKLGQKFSRITPEEKRRLRLQQEKQQEELRKQREQKAIAALRQFYQSLACDTGTLPIPPLRHRITLIFLDFKARVCRPFAD